MQTLRLGFALDYYDPRLVEMSQLVMGRDYYSCPLRKNFLICAILFFLDKMRGNYRPVVGIAAGRPHHDYFNYYRGLCDSHFRVTFASFKLTYNMVTLIRSARSSILA